MVLFDVVVPATKEEYWQQHRHHYPLMQSLQRQDLQQKRQHFYIFFAIFPLRLSFAVVPAAKIDANCLFVLVATSYEGAV